MHLTGLNLQRKAKRNLTLDATFTYEPEGLDKKTFKIVRVPDNKEREHAMVGTLDDDEKKEKYTIDPVKGEIQNNNEYWTKGQINPGCGYYYFDGKRVNVIIAKVAYAEEYERLEKFCREHNLPPPIVRHLNGDKLDNRAVNLRWGTHSENAMDRYNEARARDEKSGAGVTEVPASQF